MRLILDTDILVSALLSPGGTPDQLYQAWRDGRYTLLSSLEQLDEFRRVSRYPRLRPHLHPADAGTLVNELKLLATLIEDLPHVTVSPDPGDNFLLAMASAGQANYLVTGDKSGLLTLGRYESVVILTARQMIDLLNR